MLALQPLIWLHIGNTQLLWENQKPYLVLQFVGQEVLRPASDPNSVPEPCH